MVSTAAVRVACILQFTDEAILLETTTVALQKDLTKRGFQSDLSLVSSSSGAF
jgi:hypothetical protein